VCLFLFFPTISNFSAPSFDCHKMFNTCLHICKLLVIGSCEGDIAIIDVVMFYEKAFCSVGFFGLYSHKCFYNLNVNVVVDGNTINLGL
jgi:hypothetical protein